MGTTLTGTTPQDTYDSLIKVTDNGPISGTAKYLSDGLGNDSALALSTAKVGINTSSPDTNLHISGDANNRAVLRLASTAANRLAAVTFYGNNVESAVIGYEGGSEIVSGGVQGDLIIRNVLSGKDIILDTNAGNVGIGTSAPLSKLDVATDSASALFISNASTAISSGDLLGAISFGSRDTSVNSLGGVTNIRSYATATYNTGGVSGDLRFYTSQALSNTTGAALFGTEVGRFLATGGLTFNGDTAAANALDDYEEGTWTMGVSFNGASVGVTTSQSTGTYTKIGRQVTVNGIMVLTSKGSSTGTAVVTGLPFTIANTTANYTASTLRFTNVTFANQFQGFGSINTTSIELEEITEAGAVTTLTNADFANNSDVMVSLTYFV